MLPVDAPTLLIALTLVHFAGATLFLISWRLFTSRFEANPTSFALWSFALFSCAVGAILVGLRSQIPDYASIVAGNALLLLAAGLARMAISSFFGQKLRIPLALAASIAWVALCSYQPFIENFLARFAFIQTALAANMLWLSLICFRQNRDNLVSARLTGFVTFGQAGAYCYYLVGGILSGHQNFLALLQQDFVKITMLTLLFCAVSMIILVFAMQIEKDQLYFRTQAYHDPLTGLSNRRAFLETVETWLENIQGERAPFAVAKLDVDHFKKINEQYGQALGDALLQLLGRICKDNAGDRIFVGHLRGDIFAVFFAGMPIGKAAIFTEQIRHKFAKASEEATGGRIKATLSAGLSGGDTKDIEIRDTLRAAATALSKAKKSGRNRLSMSVAVQQADDEESSGELSAPIKTSRLDFRRNQKVA